MIEDLVVVRNLDYPDSSDVLLVVVRFEVTEYPNPAHGSIEDALGPY